MSKARELSKLPNYVLSTVAELKLAVGKEQGDKAFIGGYYADGDGGGGDFYWDAVSVEADNGGTILQVTGTTTGRWKRIYSGSINVKWFGAKGDGIVDDTTAIQNTINLNTTTYFPDGTFKITSNITIGSANRKIYGNGNKSIIYPNLTSGGICFDLNVQALRLEMSNLYFNLPTGAESNITAIKFSSVTPSNRGNEISNIWINGLQKGFESIASSYSKLSIINWNHSYLSTNTVGAISINVPNEANALFINNVDIIGGFQYGIYHSGRVFSIRDFNIAGSGAYEMSTAIYCNASAVGTIETGWIETEEFSSGNPAHEQAVEMRRGHDLCSLKLLPEEFT
jgi:hypothetical protein